jgi:signal transduction histidine kinase/ActR/RegA family two-component response regulator
MLDKRHPLKWLLTGALLVLVVIAVVTSLLIVEQQRTLGRVSRYNLTWVISQAATETLRASEAAVAAALPGSGVGKDAVLTRLDILENRLGILEGGEAKRFAASRPEFRTTITDLDQSLAAARELAEDLPSPQAAIAIRARLEPLAPRFVQMAAVANTRGGALVAEDQAKLSQLHWTLAGLLFAILACTAGLASVIVWMRERLIRQALAAKDAAETASRAKTQFLANISHELRTPLNGVLGMLQMLRLGPLQPQQQDYTEAAYRSGQMLLGQISTLLDLARIEGGKVAFAREPFRLLDVLNDVEEVLGASARAKNLRFFVTISPDLPKRVIGDAERLRRVLFNIVGNAVKFTEVGHVSLNAEPAEPERPGSAGLRFIIRDTGIGIAPGKLSTIFEPFSQVDMSTTRRYGGAGLGLAIVHETVERMGGDIQVTGSEGLGSEFRVTLFLELDQTPEPRNLSEPLPVAGEGTALGVLLVDDDRISRMVAAAFLRHAGFSVTEVGDAESALSCLERERFEVVILDYHMPVTSGATLARQIRESEAPLGRCTPILGLSAAADAADRASCLAAGMDDYLTKPVNNEDLVATVERLAHDRRQRAERTQAK